MILIFVKFSKTNHFILIVDTKLTAYELSAPEVFVNAKRAVNLSRKIEQIETKMKNMQTNANCIEKWAQEMDILLDDDELYPFLV